MNYNFEFNSPVIGRIQPFEYSYATTNEYAFTYDRDIFSDLRKFNAPIFVGKRERGIFYYKYRELFLSKKDRDIIIREDKVDFSKPKEFEVDKSGIFLGSSDKRITKNHYIPLGQKPLDTNIYSNNFLAENENKTYLFTEDVFVGKDFNTNYYEFYMLREETNNINIIREILLKEMSNVLNIYDINALDKKETPKKITITKIKQAKRETLLLEIYDTLFLEDFPIILNIYDTLELKKESRGVILSSYIISAKELYCQELSRILKNTFLEGPINNLYINEIKSLNKPLGALQVYKIFSLTEEINNLYVPDFIKWGQRETNNLYVFNIKELQSKEANKIFINKRIELTSKDRQINVSKNIIGTTIDTKEYYTNYYTQFIVHRNTSGNTHINKETITTKDIRNAFYNYYELSGYKQNKYAYLDYRIYLSTKEKKEAIKNKGFFGFHSEKDSLILRRIYSAYKDIKDAFIIQNSILSKDIKNAMLNNTDRFLQEVQIKTLKPNTEYHLYRKIEGTSYEWKNLFLQKDKDGALLEHFSESLFKRMQELYISNNENVIMNARNKINLSLTDTSQMLYHNRKGMTINITEEWLESLKKDINKNEQAIFVYRDKFNASISLNDISLSDESLPLNIEVHDNTIGFILTGKSVFKEPNNQMVKTSPANVFTPETEKFLTKDKERASTFGSTFVITEQKKAFIDYYHGIMAINNAKKTMLNFLGFTFNKTIKNVIYDTSNIFIDIEGKNAFIQNNVNISRLAKDAFIEKDNITISIKKKKTSKAKKDINATIIKKAFLEYTELSIYKKIIDTALNNTEININTIIKNITIEKDKWINRKIYIGNTFNTQINVTKIYEAFLVNDEMFISKAVETEVFETPDLSITRQKDINVNTGDYIFITKQQYETNKYVSELKQMQKLAKDMERPVEKTYNWAYVYQYEDPIDPNYEYYGLDELLLPEKDVDYSTFEDIIFDKETMKPRNPIKILDDNTFIAKYPIKHPTPDYEKTGIIYIDVPSELMYDIFMKFYQIWYANIFKFGNMSMVASLKLMLDYIYSYIILSYSGTEYLEPALRVFRQIRWFGETSVMHNAQYKITCEYEDLKSNLQTGECQIKNELSGFYVNTALKVLSTISTSIGNEAYIKLYAYNREDSKISFSVSFSGGNVDVYINDNYIDTIYSNHSFISYELPATDTENIIVLKRSASNNTGFCYVGNIIIEKGMYKNLSIEYDPDLRAGNMPLNDVVNKMVILANMYDNEAEVFEQFRKGNLAISELYKKLENYWELHHANKEKGKRLTIKET